MNAVGKSESCFNYQQLFSSSQTALTSRSLKKRIDLLPIVYTKFIFGIGVAFVRFQRLRENEFPQERVDIGCARGICRIPHRL